MKVLVDTPVCSLALRRKRRDLSPDERALELELSELIGGGDAVVIGAVRQEVLSGIRTASEFDWLCRYLHFFADERVLLEDYEEAARFYNVCRSKGVAPTHVDMLICAVAHRLGVEILTTDDDFKLYAEHLPITLHAPGSRGQQAT